MLPNKGDLIVSHVQRHFECDIDFSPSHFDGVSDSNMTFLVVEQKTEDITNVSQEYTAVPCCQDFVTDKGTIRVCSAGWKFVAVNGVFLVHSH